MVETKLSAHSYLVPSYYAKCWGENGYKVAKNGIAGKLTVQILNIDSTNPKKMVTLNSAIQIFVF